MLALCLLVYSQSYRQAWTHEYTSYGLCTLIHWQYSVQLMSHFRENAPKKFCSFVLSYDFMSVPVFLHSQLMSIVGDEVIEEVESREKESTPPSPPPIVKPRTMSMMSNGEPPPAIPVRTQESYQLVRSIPEEIPDNYDTVKTHDDGVGGTDDYEMVPAPSGPVVKDAPTSVYEAPTMYEAPTPREYHMFVCKT